MQSLLQNPKFIHHPIELQITPSVVQKGRFSSEIN
jgi:hypothetical protein